MREGKEGRPPRDMELVFFGAVTASISHELNNAMATIEQTAGLLEDLAIDCASGEPIGQEQVKEIAARIGKQTIRGAAIIRRLNVFAHSTDDAERELELHDVMEAVVALAQRLAERSGVGLEVRPRQSELRVRNDPFRVQQALYLAIREAVSAAPKGDTVRLSAVQQGATARMLVESGCADPSAELDLGSLQGLMLQIGGEIESGTKEGRVSIALVLPQTASQRADRG